MNSKIYTFCLVLSALVFCATSNYAQSNAGPLIITEFADSMVVASGQNFTLERGGTYNVKGMYGEVASARQVEISYQVYRDWAGDNTIVVDTIATTTMGTLDGTIDHDYTIPADAILDSDFPDAVAKLVQIRVYYDPVEDTFFNFFTVVTEGTTSTIELPINGLNIFPNPSGNGFITINTQENKEKTVQILDLAGRLVHNVYLSGNGPVSTDHLNPGMYIAKVTEGKATSTVKIVVK